MKFHFSQVFWKSLTDDEYEQKRYLFSMVSEKQEKLIENNIVSAFGPTKILGVQFFKIVFSYKYVQVNRSLST